MSPLFRGFAAMGANLLELLARAGQSSLEAALRYLHDVDGRQGEIAGALAVFASAGNVTPAGATKIKAARRCAWAPIYLTRLSARLAYTCNAGN